ncbi:hypothetical protein BCR43DRAFT_493621 [Syncephalastrum racemosum]|uniref:Uncharacterized protein n=1 Tax=Syncephalastrum racemosum TaxID=13706 RepID=A0A1X2HAY7_SYNRA|nr:hypothetical protein BCR43DRAFT_493621 [Syncephalastrum racemosum]
MANTGSDISEYCIFLRYMDFSLKLPYSLLNSSCKMKRNSSTCSIGYDPNGWCFSKWPSLSVMVTLSVVAGLIIFGRWVVTDIVSVISATS